MSKSQNIIASPLILLCSLVLLLPANANSTEVIDLQRGVHQEFELFVIYCDSLPDFHLFYDRVRRKCRLEISDGRFTGKLKELIKDLGAGRTVKSLELSEQLSSLIFTFEEDVHIRAYIVNGPPALLLDVGIAEREPGLLPFELGKDGYLQQGGIAEKNGNLDLALAYLDRVKEITGEEPLFTHRAGVIQHKLGRWDAALASFARTRELSEFAADAHAHRAMIYLAIGDTVKSGKEWSSFFHRDQNQVKSSTVPDEPKAVAEPESADYIRTENKQDSTFNSEIVKAGEGRYMYLGWLSLLAGAVLLVKLLFSSGKTAAGGMPKYSNGNNGYESEVVRQRPKAKYSRPGKRPVQHRSVSTVTHSEAAFPSKEKYISIKKQDQRSSEEYSRKISGRVAGSYKYGSQTGSPPARAKPRRNRGGVMMPVEMILSKANAGENELEIARSLRIGRDEVAMVLNLARLADRSLNGTQN